MIFSSKTHRTARRARRGDSGFTLPEMLVAMTVGSLLVAMMATAFSVMARAQTNAVDRVAESKDVTFVQTWLPTDLSSATQTWIEPTLPFPLNTPLIGANVLTLSRIDLATDDEFLIMYRYEEIPDRGYVLARYRVDNPGCPTPNPVIGRCEANESVKRIGVAYELPAPPYPSADHPDPWDPATESPFWALEVVRRNSGTAGDTATGEDVTVHFNSGSIYIAGGAGLSAGQEIDPDPQVIPDPVAPPSRCGRRILLLVDLSTSMVNDWNGGSYDLNAETDLRDAASGFVNAFRGTPGSMNVLGFDKWIEPISGNPGEYFDLLNDPTNEADALVNDKFPDMTTVTVSSRAFFTSSNPYGFGPHSSGPHQTASGGGTNWEVAIMASYAVPKDWHEIDGNGDNRTKDRSDLEYLDAVPDLVVLLTDGEPTRRLDDQYNYLDFSSSSAALDLVTARAAEKANLAREFGVSDIVGVLVGDTDNVEKLADVVGGTAWNALPTSDPNSNAQVADYFAADFDELGDVVKSIAQRECGGALTLQKRFTDGTNPSTTGVWDFFNNEQGTKTLDYGVASSVTFQHTFLEGETFKEFSIEEQPRDGWVLQNPTCEVGGSPVDPDRIERVDPTEPGDPVRWVFELQPDQAMSCLMHSAPA